MTQPRPSSRTPTVNAAGHPGCRGRVFPRPRPMKIPPQSYAIWTPTRPELRPSPGGKSVCLDRVRSTPCHARTTMQTTAGHAWDRTHAHQADEHIAVITCTQSRPDTRSGCEAGWSTNACTARHLEPSRPAASPQVHPHKRGSSNRCVLNEELPSRTAPPPPNELEFSNKNVGISNGSARCPIQPHLHRSPYLGALIASTRTACPQDC
jgi:hypothetical protein